MIIKIIMSLKILLLLWCCHTFALSPGMASTVSGLTGIRAAHEPPGGLSPRDMPQLVLLSFDDYLTTNRFEALLPLVTSGLKNPDGSDIRATFFISTDRHDYYFSHWLWAKGHEIAAHTMSHASDDLPHRSSARWRRELYGSRMKLSEYSGIPLEDIVGFRAPRLWYTPAMYEELSRAGYLYDASPAEYVSTNGMSRSVGGRLFPYSLDEGFVQYAIPPAIAPTNPCPGLFVMPIYPIYTTNTNGAVSAYVLTDRSFDSEHTLDHPTRSLTNEHAFSQALKYTFMQHYHGNRAPMSVIVHPQNLLHQPARIAMYIEFMEWALAYSNTWFVTTGEAIAFMRQLNASGNMDAEVPFVRPMRELLPENAFVHCPNLTYPLRVMGDHCPAFYPMWNNLHHEVAEVTGHARMIYRYHSTNNLFAYSVVVSNNTPYAAIDWQVRLGLRPDVLGHGFYNTVDVRTNSARQFVFDPGRDALGPHYADRMLHAGHVSTGVHVMVRIPSDDPHDLEQIFSGADVVLRVLKPKQPDIVAISHGIDSDIRWRDAGFAYDIEVSSSPVGPWQMATQLIYQTNWRHVADTNQLFYRINTRD